MRWLFPRPDNACRSAVSGTANGFSAAGGYQRLALVAILLALLPTIGYSANHPTALDRDAALVTSRAAVGRQLDEFTLVSSRGEVVRLSDYRGQPLLISMIYTSCYHICPTITQELAKAVDIAQEALGNDSFKVLTVGFDPKDTPERMRLFAKERGIAMPSWTFASADTNTIEAMTKNLGFVYKPTPRGFDHLTQTTIIDAKGIIHQQVYGVEIPPPRIVEPLKQLLWGTEASASTFDGWLKGVQLFCTVYDPTTGRYKFDYSIIIAIIIATIVTLGAAVFLVREWRASSARTSS